MPAEGVWSNAYFDLTGTNLSSYVKSVALVHDTASAEQTVMGDTFRTNLSALEAFSLEVELIQVTDVVDALVFPLITTTSAVTFAVRETTGTTGETNPHYSGEVVVTNYVPFQGGVGDLLTCRISMVGATTLDRAVA